MKRSWEVLEKVGNAFGGALACIGDFNQVFSKEEKRGGRPVTSSSRDKPREVINNNGLIDIHFFG